MSRAEGANPAPILPAARGVRKALEVKHVSKTFFPPTLWFRGKAEPSGVKPALQDVSLEVGEGEMVGLLGPNGAGKTTLSKIIATLIYPSAGEVLLFGQEVRSDACAARGMMGLVTCDERSFYWRLTGRQNLNFFGALYGVSKRDLADRSAELLATLDLSAAADRPYHSYSSGMKQKLAIARGLLSHPRLLIYDEPTRSLDPLSAQNIRRWILEQRAKFPEQTHLIATNQLIEAELLCDRVFIINGGRLIAQGTVAEIRARADISELESHQVDIKGGPYRPSASIMQHGDVSQLLVEPNSDGASVTLIARRDSDALSAVLAEITGAGIRIVACSTKQTSFDDVFCSVIEAEGARRAKP
jgi:ABC-2 type transport system ATP-binding protein